MAGKRVLVLGRFRGGVRQADIREQLRAQGNRLTGLVRRADVVIAGSRCGARLTEARAAGLTILDQDSMATLTNAQAPASPQVTVKSTAKPAAKPAEEPTVKPTTKPAAKPRPPRRPNPTAEDAIRQIGLAPMAEHSWWQLGQLFKEVPEARHAALVDEIAANVHTWPAHIRGTHTEWLVDLAAGVVDPRLRLVGRLTLTEVIKKHGLETAAAVLDRCPEHLPGVRQLRINHFKGSVDWLGILTPARMAPFTELDLMYNHLGAQGLGRVLSAVDPSRISLLDLRANALSVAGMKMLAEAGLTSLRWLHLYQNDIKNKGLAHLTKCPALSGLSYLSVEYNHLKSAAGGLLARATFAESLTGLKVKYNDLFAAGGKALARAKTLGNLRLLDISCNEVGDEALTAMAHSKTLNAIEELRIVGNGGNLPLITDDGLWALSEGDGMPRLARLDLQSNRCTSSGLEALLRSDKRTALHTLNINHNNIACDSAAVLTEADLPVKLRDLEIGFDDGSQQKFQAMLRRAAVFGGLQRLVLRLPWKLQKKPAVTEALLSSPHLAGIEDLELRDCRFSDKALQRLIDTPFSALRRLNLSSPGFDDARLATFMTAPWLHDLRQLVLYEYPDKPDYAPLKAMFENTPTSCVAF